VSAIDIRRTAIVAMFSDDVLMEQLVLKGGNALDLVHGVTGRGSLDIDFSIEGDFDNLAEVEARCFRALRDRFDSVGLLVFDEKFLRKPSVHRAGQGERWGGYRIEFKLLGGIREQREFHRADWPAVVQALTVRAEGYDFYFDFVAADVDKLEALWHE
jgi:hypothetical protein